MLRNNRPLISFKEELKKYSDNFDFGSLDTIEEAIDLCRYSGSIKINSGIISLTKRGKQELKNYIKQIEQEEHLLEIDFHHFLV